MNKYVLNIQVKKHINLLETHKKLKILNIPSQAFNRVIKRQIALHRFAKRLILLQYWTDIYQT